MSTTLNIPLLQEAVAFAEQSAAGKELVIAGRRAVWDQGLYATLNELSDEEPDDNTCGTAFCIAGYVATRHPGYKAEVRRGTYFDGGGFRWLSETIDGKPFIHDEVAAEMLGITQWDAEDLFEGANTLEEVQEIAADLIADALASA